MPTCPANSSRCALILLHFCGWLMLSQPALAQTRVHFGHFASGASGDRLALVAAGTLRSSLLAFGQFEQELELPAGELRLELRDGAGSLRGGRDLRLLPDIPYTVYAVDRGAGQPLEIRVVRETAQPLRAERFAIQLYSAAVHPRDPLRYRLRCGLLQATGTLTFGREEVARGSADDDGFACTVRVETGDGNPEDATEAVFEPRLGILHRVVLIGDGDIQPYRVSVFDSVRGARPLVAADTAMEGLWFDPGDSGSGLTLLIEPRDQGPAWATGVLYGYDLAGDPTWALIEGPVNTPAELASQGGIAVLESVGGNLRGDRQPVRLRLGVASLDFHSCREATLFLVAGSEFMPRRLGRRDGDGPEQLFRLQRLLPIDACVRGQGAGVVP